MRDRCRGTRGPEKRRTGEMKTRGQGAPGKRGGRRFRISDLVVSSVERLRISNCKRGRSALSASGRNYGDVFVMTIYEDGSLGSPSHPSGARPRRSPATPLVPQGRAGSHGSGPGSRPLRTASAAHRTAWLYGARQGASGSARSHQTSKSVPSPDRRRRGGNKRHSNSDRLY